MISTNVRAAFIAAAMVGASAMGAMLTPRHYVADTVERESLSQIVPRSFGDWRIDQSIVPVQPSPDLQRVLDATYDEVLALTFRDPKGRRVMLSMAYGRNQHKGMNTHKPEICYPAQGFRVVESPVRGEVQADKHRIGVTRLMAQAGSRREPITYWLMVGDEVTYFGYPQRWVAIRYGMAGLIPDGVLVRVSSVDVDTQAAYALHEQFIRDMLRAIPPGRLHRLLGAA